MLFGGTYILLSHPYSHEIHGCYQKLRWYDSCMGKKYWEKYIGGERWAKDGKKNKPETKGVVAEAKCNWDN